MRKSNSLHKLIALIIVFIGSMPIIAQDCEMEVTFSQDCQPSSAVYVEIEFNGGNPPFVLTGFAGGTYEIGETESFGALSGNEFFFEVTDALGCTEEFTLIIDECLETFPCLEDWIVGVIQECDPVTGLVDIEMELFTPPEFTAFVSVQYIDPVLSDFVMVGEFESTSDIPDIPADVWTLITITVPESNCPQQHTQFATIDCEQVCNIVVETDTVCNSELGVVEIIFSISGGVGNYQISGDINTSLEYEDSETYVFESFPNREYAITITDSVGCTRDIVWVIGECEPGPPCNEDWIGETEQYCDSVRGMVGLEVESFIPIGFDGFLFAHYADPLTGDSVQLGGFESFEEFPLFPPNTAITIGAEGTDDPCFSQSEEITTIDCEQVCNLEIETDQICNEGMGLVLLTLLPSGGIVDYLGNYQVSGGVEMELSATQSNFVFVEPNQELSFTLIDSVGCTENYSITTIDCVYDGILSSMESELLLYPIPATEFLSMEIKDAVSDSYRVMIFDITGKAVSKELQWNVGNNSKLDIGIQHLPAGSYFLEVFNEDDRAWKRFVKY